MKKFFCICLIFLFYSNPAQIFRGIVTYSHVPVKDAIVSINKGTKHVLSDSLGYFQIYPKQPRFVLNVYYPGFLSFSRNISLDKDTFIYIQLLPDTLFLNEIDIEGKSLLLNKKPDAFNTEVYDACVLASSSAVSLFEGVQNINGLRPQLNCNICNTGDIHINGMEGAYTNVLIDGMPVVGGIASIYGLSGISADIIEKIEINKYPGSVLYGSDNIGGTINIITKTPKDDKLKTYVQLYSSSYMDHNLEVSMMKKTNKYSYINSLNTIYFDKIFDANKDGFTDVTLQKRISVFHKSMFSVNDTSDVQFIVRGLLEDRWGGQVNWNKKFRGTDSVYGESIVTKRIESIVKAPFYVQKNRIENNVSYNYHYQNSYYGTLFFEAHQHNLYYQSFTNVSSNIGQHIFGAAFKYLFYKDNTEVFKNASSYSIWLVPAVYSENTFDLSTKTKLMFALRHDYHNIHKHITTPRLAVLYTPFADKLIIRSGVTTGFRPVQLFTEDHAALTGARKIVIQEKLLPEKSYAGYFNVQFNPMNNKISFDLNTWYVYFSNRIVPDYSQPDKIIYYNLGNNNFSVNRGVSLQIQSVYKNYIQAIVGISLLDNYVFQNNEKRRLFLSEPWSGTWIVRGFISTKITVEYTGNIYGSMQLPLAGDLDPRPSKSPVYSIQNIQLKYSWKSTELTVGVKNFLNFTPDKNLPFLIARANDPFDKNVMYDTDGNPVSSSDNPYALTFDPTYTYASMQKIRLFFTFSVYF